MKHSFRGHLKIISKEKIRMKKLLIVLAACLTLSGCGGVSQSDYDAAVQERDALATQVAELQTTNDSLTAENDTLSSKNESLSAENESLKAENQTLTAAASTAASTSSAAASADTPAADTAAASETKDTAAEYSYIGNRNSYKFHRPSCSYLPAEHNRVYYQTREEAVNDGMVPCKRCDP